MNYWHMNLHPTDEKDTDEAVKKLVLSHTIGMAIWERTPGEIDPQIDDFKKRVKIGDIVAVLNGQNPIALVEVIGEWYEFDDKDSVIWYRLRRATKILCIKGGNDYIDGLQKFPMRTKTLTIASNENTDTYNYIDAWYKHCKNSRTYANDRF